MAKQPKALICSLGNSSGSAQKAEAQLRSAGFATASLRYKDVGAEKNAWMNIATGIADASVSAFILLGVAEDFTEEIFKQMILLSLSFAKGAAPLITFALADEGAAPAAAQTLSLPPLLSHVPVYPAGASLGAKLAAARFKKITPPVLPFHVKSYLDPYTGLWLEVAPGEGLAQPDFMLGVLDAEITAFGIGPWGGMPERSTLSFPLRGIKGELGAQSFDACAAKDALNGETACYLKVEGMPSGILFGAYPGEDSGADMAVLRFFE